MAFFVGTANVLKAEVKEGRAAVGSSSVAVPADIPDGSNVRAIVRPHDVHVVKAEEQSPAPTGRWAACGASPAWART